VNPSVLPNQVVTSEKITIDYLNHANDLKQVFTKHFREPSLRRFNIDRHEIVDKLLSYNEKLSAPKQVMQNITSLSQPETYAVITGQQPGLFSGALYTIYKAISAIVVCERLSNEKRSFVPIFWNASEDHDLSEVNHIAVFRENEPFEIYCDCGLGGIAFSFVSLEKSELKRMLAIIEGVSPDSEFKASLLKEINRIIQRSLTIADFFSRFMIHLFGELGVVVIEPEHLRNLMTPVFERLIRMPTKCTQILNEAGLELNKLGYPPRIHKKSNMCNFFVLNDQGKRLRVTYNREFRVGREAYSQRELLRLLDDDPSRFSANAITRPITQDFLFPTFAYVAGPNEIAYLAQLKGIYDFFELEMPVVFPRFGATLVERKVSKVLAKYNLEIHGLRNPEETLKKLAKEKVDGLFDSFRSEILTGMGEVTRRAESIDETLVGPCSLARGRILKTLEVLEDKVTSKLKEHDLVVRQQVTKASNNLFPFGDLQERRMNVLEYLIKFGKEFLSVVHKNFSEADYGEHRVIRC